MTATEQYYLNKIADLEEENEELTQKLQLLSVKYFVCNEELGKLKDKA